MTKTICMISQCLLMETFQTQYPVIHRIAIIVRMLSITEGSCETRMGVLILKKRYGNPLALGV